MMVVGKEPWQNGPTELIQYALNHLHRNSDFDQRVAFLLLDVGVETLFKTYLTLPEKVTGTTVSFTERKKAAEGNFHELVSGLEKAADTRVKEFNLAHVEFYHDLRNKLYHQGNGITIPSDKARGYAELAVRLLKALLEVDLADELLRPEIETKAKAAVREKEEKNKQAFHQQIGEVKQALDKLIQAAKLGIELIEPKLALPSSEKHYYDSQYEFGEQTALTFEGAVKRETEWPNVLMKWLSNAELAADADPDQDFIQLLLSILQKSISNTALPEVAVQQWSMMYFFARHYPDWDRETLTKYTYTADGLTLSAEDPSIEEIIDQGKQHVEALDNIRKTILKWIGQSTP